MSESAKVSDMKLLILINALKRLMRSIQRLDSEKTIVNRMNQESEMIDLEKLSDHLMVFKALYGYFAEDSPELIRLINEAQAEISALLEKSA